MHIERINSLGSGCLRRNRGCLLGSRQGQRRLQQHACTRGPRGQGAQWPVACAASVHLISPSGIDATAHVFPVSSSLSLSLGAERFLRGAEFARARDAAANVAGPGAFHISCAWNRGGFMRCACKGGPKEEQRAAVKTASNSSAINITLPDT